MKLSFARPLRNRYLFIGDLIFLTLAAYASYLLRLETFALGRHWPGFLVLTGLALVITPFVFYRTGIYARYWRYASVEELVLLSGSVTIAVVLVGAISLLTVQFLPGSYPLPHSIPLIFLLLALATTAGPRFLLRLWPRAYTPKRPNGITSRSKPQGVLIMGAGDAGVMVVRELKANPHLGLEPICFLDDDVNKHHTRIHDVPVLGDRHALAEIVRQHHIEQVIIAMPTAPGTEIRDIVRRCDEVGTRTRIIPGIYELLDGSVNVKQLREVRIEDLLRREPVYTDVSAVSAMLRGKRVLVTGAGGSIGSELCRQILRGEPAQLVLLGHGENSIFQIENELIKLQAATSAIRPGSRITPVIADVRFPDRINAVFGEHRPEIVFHAAAHKHVPLMESNAVEAITNNVLGTRNVVEAALAAGVERFLMISTDKAVNPTSIMGASKRTAELIVQEAAQRTGRAFVAVRFGNVLGSRGSVVPFFQQQIAAGGPVTVTHPEMRRYFMTIPEAVQLVLQAAVLGQGAEVFVLDMGAPVRIADLAYDLIRLSGLEPERDIQVAYTGLRPGEKLFEELFLAHETYRKTVHEKVFVYQNGMGSELANCQSQLLDGVDALVAAAQRGETGEVKRWLQKLVPEYQGLAADRTPSV